MKKSQQTRCTEPQQTGCTEPQQTGSLNHKKRQDSLKHCENKMIIMLLLLTSSWFIKWQVRELVSTKSIPLTTTLSHFSACISQRVVVKKDNSGASESAISHSSPRKLL